MDAKVIGRIRKVLEGIDAGAVGDDEQLTLTQQLEQLIAAGSAPYTEITRAGRAFQVTTTTEASLTGGAPLRAAR